MNNALLAPLSFWTAYPTMGLCLDWTLIYLFRHWKVLHFLIFVNSLNPLWSFLKFFSIIWIYNFRSAPPWRSKIPSWFSFRFSCCLLISKFSVLLYKFCVLFIKNFPCSKTLSAVSGPLTLLFLQFFKKRFIQLNILSVLRKVNLFNNVSIGNLETRSCYSCLVL